MGLARNLANLRPSSAGLIEAGDLDTSATQLFGMRNRIINGAMIIDQRNNGASVTISDNTAVYTLDRWRFYENTDAVIAVQQVSDAPVGFSNSMRTTVSTADASLSASQIGIVSHRIEGNNFADMAWGTSSAQPITLSFWAKSSVTGKFSGSLYNLAQGVARTYVFDYTINSANTWEYKTITIPGVTVGTWTTGTGATLEIIFGLGTGSDYKTATVGQWFTGFASQSTGSVDLVNTLNATWQITGVQLEKGSTATSFDYRPYGAELALCQRYYEIGRFYQNSGSSSNSPFYEFLIRFTVEKRASPSMSTVIGNYTHTSGGNGIVPEYLSITARDSLVRPVNQTTWSAAQFTWLANGEL